MSRAWYLKHYEVTAPACLVEVGIVVADSLRFQPREFASKLGVIWLSMHNIRHNEVAEVD